MGVEPKDTHMLLLLLFSSFQTFGAWKNNNKQSKKTSEQGFTMSVRPSVCLCVYDESFDAPSSSFTQFIFLSSSSSWAPAQQHAFTIATS